MDNLTAIARQAMIEHGLLPDFSPEAQRQADSISQTNSKTRPAIRDLRALLWSSIDNDDTRDLDQLPPVGPGEPQVQNADVRSLEPQPREPGLAVRDAERVEARVREVARHALGDDVVILDDQDFGHAAT